MAAGQGSGRGGWIPAVGGWDFRCGCGSSPDGRWSYNWAAGSGPGGTTFGFESGGGRTPDGGGFGFGWGGSTSTGSSSFGFGSSGGGGGGVNFNGRFGFDGIFRHPHDQFRPNGVRDINNYNTNNHAGTRPG